MARSRAKKFKKVAVLMGGMSEERDISLRTGGAVLAALRAAGYDATGIDAGVDVAAKITRSKADAVFIALHGRYGEDGCIQGALEIMGIPYTGSGVLASSIAMDKVVAKKMFLVHGVPTPKFTEVCCQDEIKGLKTPYILKPATSGSAIGVSVVRKKTDARRALSEALKYGLAMAEEFIHGRELTVSILDGEVLPVIEIHPKKGFYDYRAKYTKGMTDFLVPAPLKKSVEIKVMETALAAYHSIGCLGAARVDVMLDGKDNPYVLEVNTIPGMTELSLFPRAAAAVGMDYGTLVVRMLDGAGLGKF